MAYLKALPRLAASAGFKAAAIMSAVCVFAWIMPLGAFIKPSQEKTACDGRRAFHMCSMVKVGASSAVKPSEGRVTLSSAAAIDKLPKASAGGANHDFGLNPIPAAHMPGFSRLAQRQEPFVPLEHFFSTDPVPKAIL